MCLEDLDLGMDLAASIKREGEGIIKQLEQQNASLRAQLAEAVSSCDEWSAKAFDAEADMLVVTAERDKALARAEAAESAAGVMREALEQSMEALASAARKVLAVCGVAVLQAMPQSSIELLQELREVLDATGKEGI